MNNLNVIDGNFTKEEKSRMIFFDQPITNEQIKYLQKYEKNNKAYIHITNEFMLFTTIEDKKAFKNEYIRSSIESLQRRLEAPKGAILFGRMDDTDFANRSIGACVA